MASKRVQPFQFTNELADFKKYLESDANEDAKRPLLYPLLKHFLRRNLKLNLMLVELMYMQKVRY